MISSKCKQNVHKHIPITSVKKNPTSKTETIFIANYKTFSIFKVFEQLSSSFCWQVMAIRSKVAIVTFCGS